MAPDKKPADFERPPGTSAEEWQAELFDRLVQADPIGAFGLGLLTQVLWQKRIDLASPFLTAGSSLLEIGSGNGHIAKALAERTQAKVLGIDVSGECVAYAEERNAHPLVEYRRASIENLAVERSFDLVTMYEVLEHVDDPPATLRRIHDWLVPGGRLILSTPNRSSLNRRLKRLRPVRALYRRASQFDPDAAHPGHVDEYHFEELRSMLLGSGFEIEREDGVILLMPFHDAIPTLARRRRFVQWNISSGALAPRLASAVYFVARRSA